MSSFSGEHRPPRDLVHEMSTTDCRQSDVPVCVKFSMSSALPIVRGHQTSSIGPKTRKQTSVDHWSRNLNGVLYSTSVVDRKSVTLSRQISWIGVPHLSPGNYSLRERKLRYGAAFEVV